MSSPFCVRLHVCDCGFKMCFNGILSAVKKLEAMNKKKKINDKSDGKGQNENVRITTSMLKFPLSFVKDEMSG